MAKRTIHPSTETIYFSDPDGFFIHHPQASALDAHDVASQLVTQAMATCSLLMGNLSEENAAPYSNEIMSNALWGVRTQLELACAAMNMRSKSLGKRRLG